MDVSIVQMAGWIENFAKQDNDIHALSIETLFMLSILIETFPTISKNFSHSKQNTDSSVGACDADITCQ